EDALEAVLRERLNAIAIERVEQSGSWFGEPPPARITAFAPADQAMTGAIPDLAGCEPLRRYVTCNDTRLDAVLGDWLYRVYVVSDAERGLSLRQEIPAGAILVTPEGHVFTRHTVSFHAPDSELHGVLTRQREIEQLGGDIGAARPELESLRMTVVAAEQD